MDNTFDPDHVYNVTAWRSAPWWLLVIEGIGVTQVIRLDNAEHMAADYLGCWFDVDPERVKVHVERGIGPAEPPCD